MKKILNFLNSSSFFHAFYNLFLLGHLVAMAFLDFQVTNNDLFFFIAFSAAYIVSNLRQLNKEAK